MPFFLEEGGGGVLPTMKGIFYGHMKLSVHLSYVLRHKDL